MDDLSPSTPSSSSRKATPKEVDIDAFANAVLRIRLPRLSASGEWEFREEPDEPMDVRKQASKAVKRARAWLGEKFSSGWPPSWEDVRDAVMAHLPDVLMILAYICSAYLGIYGRLLSGFFGSVALMSKNVWYLSGYLFDFMEYVEDYVKAALLKLEVSVNGKVTEFLTPPEFAIAMAVVVSVSIEIARESIEVEDLLPRVLRTRAAFTCSLLLPLMLLPLGQLAWGWWHRPHMETTGQAERDITAGLEGIVSLVVASLIQTWSVIRLCVNSAIAWVEDAVTDYLHENLDPEELGDIMQQGASLALVAVSRSCERQCTM